MSIRQDVVKSADQLPLLIADIYEAAGLLRRAGEAMAKAENQTQARWQLLSVISGQARTVPQAARRLGVSRQAVQRVATELVGAELAVFMPNAEHKASPLLELSPSGRRVLERINRRAARFHRDVALPLEPDDVDRARRVLGVLVERVASG